VLNYIDLALAGAYAELQDFYRRGCVALEDHCRKTYSKSFAQLTAAEQDAVITAMIEGKALSFTWPTSQAFFNTAAHAHDGRNVCGPGLRRQQGSFAGWRLVGFPGAQPVFTEADMVSREAFTRGPSSGCKAQARRS
jgi:gluconate 2-dehydrogenase gamma chain